MRITDLDEGLHANVAESFDKKVAWKTGFSSKYSREFYAEIDGTLLTVDYFSPDAFESTVEVSFRRNGEQSITGEGKAHVIFGAVVNHINDFVQEHDLDRVIFAAHKPQGSFGVRDTTRSDTYRKMMKKLSNTLGFDYSVEDRGNNDIFTLTKKDRQIKEEQTPDIIDNVEGWGAVPNNQDVDYLGLRVMMKPSIFLSLAASLGNEPSEKIAKYIQDGGKIGSPFLVIDIPPEWEENDLSKVAKVLSHEGRNRMKSILKVYGDIPIETHLFFSGGVRNRHLTDKMISSMKSKMQSEKSKKTLNGPLFITNTNINEWGRIVKGVNTTPDVNTDEIKTQAAKFGNRVDRDGRPPLLGKKTRGSKTNVLFNLGLAESKVLNELIMDTSGISFDSNWKGEYWGKRITQIPGNPQSASDYREFEIFFAGTSQKRSVYITDKKERIVGRLELMKISNKAPIYRVNVAVMAGKFRGKNIMQGVYVHLIQEHGMILAADITQSPGAMRGWAKLNRNPAITVFSAVEDKDGKWEYSQLEGDDFLSGSSIIYRSEYDDMIREIQNEISSIEKAIETARKEYKQSRNTEILSDIDYLINRIKNLENEILKIKKEKKQRESAGIDKTFLLATRSKKLPATESTIKINTSSIFPELEQELAEGPRDAIRKLAKGAAVATSIGTAGFMGTMNTGDDPKSSRKSTGAEYVQTQKSTDKKTAEPEQEIKTQPEVSGSELAPEKSIRPDARPTDITITNKPAEKTLIKYARNAGINGTELASLLAQVAVETSGYDQMVETGSSEYFHRYEKEHSPRLAKMLGNTEPGDGYKYRGRGYVQLTGRYNYNEAGKALGLDLINNPELAAEPKNALKIALWFWEWRVASNTDDYDNTKRVTRLLNGGSHGLEKRKKYFDVYKDRLKELGFTENKKTYPYMEKYTPLQIAIIEGGHTLDEEDIVENKRKNRLFDALMEGIRIQLERDDDLYVLHIKDSKQKHRVEVRGKSGYESGNYDEDDPLHQLIDNLGKAANISDLINGEPVYINPDHPDGPRAIRYLKAAMNESKDTEIKIHNTSVLDHYRGESFGEKLLSVDGILKARIKLSILGDEVYIQYIETAEDSKRMGYAKKLVDDLFREFPNKTISVSMMTDSGGKFFRSQYRVDDKTGELKQKQKAEK